MSRDVGEFPHYLIDRLGRRGVLTITAEDGAFEVRLITPGPYVGGRCTIDKADLFEHCRLGARSWQGDGPDLVALLVTCEIESRPPDRSVDDLAWSLTRRRDSRTAGPPLPTYRRWHGWSPGHERWLRTSAHAHEYLAGYLQFGIEEERKFETEQRESERRSARQRVRRVLEGSS